MRRNVARPGDSIDGPLWNERGSTLVKAPIAAGVAALALTGLTTFVQFAWTDLALSSAVGATTRFASNVSSSSGSAAARTTTADQVRRWANDVAAEAHVAPDDITVVARRRPSGEVIEIEQLAIGDEVTLRVEKTVTNPLYHFVAKIADGASRAVGHDDVLDPAGISVVANATNRVG